MNERIGNVVLNYKYYLGEDLYSDGEVEDELLDIVQNNEEGEYDKIIGERNKWPVIYHLSHLRANIIEWMPINNNETVLEIGSGCGAITGTLANKARKVTCIDLSKKRSLINAYRNKEKDNIEILVGNFEDIEKGIVEKYDYITLIGVFEYGESYISSERPYENFLKIISKHLNKNGKIIIAIENKLGLKYWAGCKEDHVGRYFDGIEGYPNTRGVKTFSKKELEEIIQKCGFNKYRFYYPYPDYKLPNIIYSDDYLPKNGELNNNMRNFDAERMVLFDESKVYDSIIKEGLFDIYSNSYLMIIENSEESNKDCTIIYSKYSNERDDKFKIRTDIIKDINEKLFVQKVALTTEAQNHINDMYENYNLLSKTYKGSNICMNKCIVMENGLKFEYIQGKTLEEELDKLLYEKNYTKLFEKIKNYIDAIEPGKVKRNFEITEEFAKVFGKAKLPSYLKSAEITDVDLIFGNVIIGEKWNVIDYEWTFNFPIPLNFILYRALSGYIFNSNQKNELMNLGLYKLLGITDEEIYAYGEMEKCFEKYVLGSSIKLNNLYGKTTRPNIDVQQLIYKQNTSLINEEIQVFYDYGEGFSETHSYKTYPVFNENNKIVLNVDISENTKQIRIDPSNCYSLVKINSLVGYDNVKYSKLNYYTNGMRLNNKSLLFINNDPQIILPDLGVNTCRVELIFEIQIISKEFAIELCSFIEDREEEVARKISELKYKDSELTLKINELKDKDSELTLKINELKYKEEKITESNKIIEGLQMELEDKNKRIQEYNKLSLIKKIRKQI
ncbi:hypothetical protein CBE01nite_16650 [Clostridium beijerinckii]|uniref:Methyltransferase n=1 Tax=Clostridium beijerinckii TaxID=1520 RepID=A0AB74VEV2_CLOBE|nr:class I SAM-dependent methyltransferase [Clostridium beijerinckii]NRZ29279.1 2-polyprenyl-3-methyl-5-hydroxy-6-metoxy-1,4-benzoquinol methylase [Clostridium beijerinckii]NYB94951.1 2-polyprenyl-3-methyl-5-hydroxy-6-metoxy-1,4-benzoquinol methylase [Clostridium beijerinckii]OOM25735.1 ubiquinone biosynthesis O-methyltransferase [Clostridium beijerinckii]QUN34919.1 methyltransferase [Clostridium beijerinckii]SQB00099.1 type 12 methyltransferase [Clostridium beijerinckii]